MLALIRENTLFTSNKCTLSFVDKNIALGVHVSNKYLFMYVYNKDVKFRFIPSTFFLNQFFFLKLRI